jgi:hypothetical protein
MVTAVWLQSHCLIISSDRVDVCCSKRVGVGQGSRRVAHGFSYYAEQDMLSPVGFHSVYSVGCRKQESGTWLLISRIRYHCEAGFTLCAQ